MQTIIVYEAYRSIREILTLILAEEGFQVIALADCGSEQLALIENAKPDLMILDFILDGETAIHMCQLLKKKYPKLPVLALSCNNQIKDLYAAYGFDGYIEKPFDIDGLLRTIHYYLVIRAKIAKKRQSIKAAINSPGNSVVGKTSSRSKQQAQ